MIQSELFLSLQFKRTSDFPLPVASSKLVLLLGGDGWVLGGEFRSSPLHLALPSSRTRAGDLTFQSVL